MSKGEQIWKERFEGMPSLDRGMIITAIDDAVEDTQTDMMSLMEWASIEGWEFNDVDEVWEDTLRPSKKITKSTKDLLKLYKVNH